MLCIFICGLICLICVWYVLDLIVFFVFSINIFWFLVVIIVVLVFGLIMLIIGIDKVFCKYFKVIVVVVL